MIYTFDDCELDAGRVVLRRGGRSVPVEPQVFDVLCCLIARRGQVVRKEEILDEVWGSRFVSESALTSRIKSARRAVGDDGTRQHIIRTVHGKGYEFVADVVETVEIVEVAADGAQSDAERGIAQIGVPAPPLAVHPLIGRDDLLDRLMADLATGRLVTIVGPAGVGKTSVGLELARRMAAGHRDGVYVIELVTVGDAAAALASIATTLEVSIRQETSIGTAIVDMLRSRQALVVLDNCEHVVETVAEFADQILRAAPDVTLVATSREPLAIAGEHVHVVEPLEVSGLDDLTVAQLGAVPAVELFTERACAADSRFELNDLTAPAVAEICRRLDGIPLALELAASRTHAIDVDEIARRLDERLRLLKGVRRGADPRHSALADAIGWSYDLLAPGERRLFAQLAVFAGSFDLDAAEAICDADDVLDLLTRLSQRSMLVVRRPATGGTRYEMLETLREFGRSRLDDLDNVQLFTAHANHFAAVAADVERDVQTADEATATQRADRCFADLRAAQRFAVEVGDVDTAYRLITSIREYAMRGLRYEVFSWADTARVALGDTAHPLYHTVQALCAYGAFVRGELDRALALVDEVEAVDDHSVGSATGLRLRVCANVMYAMGEVTAGVALNARLLEWADASGNPSAQAHARYMASVAASSIEDRDGARRLAEAAFAPARRSGSPTDLASAWLATGFATDDDATALTAFASADRIAAGAGNRWMSAFARTEASGLRVSHGDVAGGCAGLAETVDTWYRAGEWSQQWLTLSRCVIALDRIGRAELAAEVFGAIERHTTVDAPPVITSVRDQALATRESLDTQLGRDRADELRSVGGNLPVAEIVRRTRHALLDQPDPADAT